MASMKEFLNTYYQRLIFNEMSQEQFVQFCEWIRDGKATDNQKIWAKKYLTTNAAGEYETDPAGLYIRKPLPDVTDPTEGLSDEEWEKLFKAFRNAFQNMDANKKSFEDNDKATKFLKDFFGSGKIFQNSQILPSNDRKIYNPTSPDNTLYKFLLDNERVLKSRLSSGYYSVLDDDFTYQDLLTGIGSGKYKTDVSFRKKMLSVAGYLESERADLTRDLGLYIPDFSDYDTWFDDSVQASKLGEFKASYRKILNRLRSEKKTREVFSNYDSGKISGPLNKALTNLNYDDEKSEDYVRPKRSDELTVTQRISEWWGDTYSDVLEKYIKFKGDELFFSNEARLICKNLPKDLKKTDDLDAVLTAMGKAKEKLTTAHDLPTLKHLKWFQDTMAEIKADPNMKKTYAGALQHGGQLRNLVKEVMIKAVKQSESDPSAIDKAKTTLELLSVLHFGFTTSKIMDTLKDTEFTLLSDKDLSWNKNEATKFITKALDKSVKFAFMSIGYGITMAKNAYSLSKTKIRSYSDRKNNNLYNAHEEHLRHNAENRQNLNDELNANRALRTTTQTRLNTIQGTASYADTETRLNGEISTHEGYLANISNNITTLETAINEYIANGSHSEIPDDTAASQLSNALQYIKAEYVKNPVTPLRSLTVGVTGSLQTALNNIQTNWANIDNYRTDLEKSRTDLNDLVNGTETVNQLNNKIAEQENEIANWDANHNDKMEDLIQHWNMLETGRNTKTGPMYNWFSRLSKKKAQDDLNANKAAIIAQYRASHSIAA